ncbi:AAA family ATPase [Ruminococcus sp. AF24-32LB]|nr:AAA family ATPase [Ruminococcus sp.]RGI59806.1 AAA family ATPase [Ruminococcus sp. TM10-9AT]RGW17471.1 AAA family ATPase [Ruminococcus sp. AF13-37]RGW22881.1 AAA family ATPase [Ruminococcus sp. AF13-28]RHG54208.1 AAA family ATPase [Ruminococcus sp. AM22-13]RHO85804.1 AAA family ATPase [Ruminococcus sp. AF42-9BH]RHQ63804.1 AAA family ATPase [Ruminococcus sp. AF24-32LB]RHQ97271.1 AAA family ATPase [Ruminococcus sp. AF21-3]RHT35229.1 AAA family ATPase [Ruminococcus sp. AM32-17LB]
MPVFDFSGASDKKPGVQSECTYTTFQSNEKETSPEKPIMILDNSSRQWKHHSCGIFTNPIKRTSFEFKEDDGVFSADIISIDSRFVSLLKWLGENHINVRLSGENKENGYAVYKIRETAFGGGTKLSAEDGFLQFMIERLLASSAPAEIVEDEDEEETGDEMKLTSIQSITDFMTCAGRTLPDNIRLWARRNLAVARSHEVSPEERRHAQRALSIMMNIQWKNNYFEAIDPQEARRILDEELYGMESVKQRIIETIIQINRTHTLPAYGLLLVGPAGTGKSQIAYAVARILKLPWTTLDMSSINDPEQLTGSSRIYANAKPGIIMEAFSAAGESNLVFIINELDKAASGKGNGNPADVLLTLLDNLGFTDNYMECMVPTVGVYPIATANDKSQISAPLMSRFAVIDIPDYTSEEKKIIFSKYVLPKVLKRMSLKAEECVVTEEGLNAIVELHKNTSGIRDLEQAAEHIAANALYQIEVDHLTGVTFNAEMVRGLLS